MYHLYNLEVRSGSHWAKIKVSSEWLLVALAFLLVAPASGSCPHSLACGPLPSSEPAIARHVFLILHHSGLDSLLPVYLDPVIKLGPSSSSTIISFFKGQLVSNVIVICNLNFPLPCYLIYLWVTGLRLWSSLGGTIILPAVGGNRHVTHAQSIRHL